MHSAANAHARTSNAGWARHPLVLAAVALTFLPFAWKALIYGSLGSYLPLTLCVLTGGLLLVGFLAGEQGMRRTVRIWAAAMILWAVARVLLMAAVASTDLNEAHLRAQMTIGYFAASSVYLAAGVAMWRHLGRLTRGHGRAT